MEIKKSISKGQFKHYFNEIGELLRHFRKPEDNYYLTMVTIQDLPESEQIRFTVTVHYGPVATVTESGNSYCEMAEHDFVFVYNKDGSFAGYGNEDPEEDRNAIYPSHLRLPSYEDFPDPEEEDLFCAICRTILRCGDCGKPLSKILFVAQYPYCYGDYDCGTPAYQDDGGSAPSFDGHVKGVCLKSDMVGSEFSCILREDLDTRGEYALIFRVSYTY